jgi:hypothetical protein
MLRYLRCVQKMKQIIHDNNLTVMATNARYVSRVDRRGWGIVNKDKHPQETAKDQTEEEGSDRR